MPSQTMLNMSRPTPKVAMASVAFIRLALVLEVRNSAFHESSS
eukprot:SAG22_NODE_3141_length_1906_cov_18.510791_2_plen_43_part_00